MSYDGALHDPRGFVRFGSYELEKAPSGRAKCRAAACNDKIAKGELRFTTVTAPSDFGMDDREVRHCRHLRCVTKRMWKEAAYKHGGFTSLPGFDQLSDTEQELVLNIIAAAQPGMTQQEILEHRVAEQAAALEQAQAAIEELQARVEGANNGAAAGAGAASEGGGDGAGPSNPAAAAGRAGNPSLAEPQDEEEEGEIEEAPVFDLTNTQRPASPEVLYVESDSEPEQEPEPELEVAVHFHRQGVKLQREGNLTEILNEAAEEDEEIDTLEGEGGQGDDMLVLDTATGSDGANKKAGKKKKKEKGKKQRSEERPEKQPKKAKSKNKKKKKQRQEPNVSTRVTRSSMKRSGGAGRK